MAWRDLPSEINEAVVLTELMAALGIPRRHVRVQVDVPLGGTPTLMWFVHQPAPDDPSPTGGAGVAVSCGATQLTKPAGVQLVWQTAQYRLWPALHPLERQEAVDNAAMWKKRKVFLEKCTVNGLYFPAMRFHPLRDLLRPLREGDLLPSDDVLDTLRAAP